MSRDYYGDSRVLAANLADAGLGEWAKKLEDILEGGVTSTEILMGIRWHLRQLVQAEGSVLDARLGDAATELADAIDAVLN